MDVTAFHPDQRDWGSTRAHRAPILTLWSEPPGSAPNYDIGYLLFNGRLILDYARNPIRAFRNLPLTISSAVKGFRLETWVRQDYRRLRTHDILARLRTRNTPSGRVPLHKPGDFTDRTYYFRVESGLVPFRPRNSPDTLAAKAYLDSLRTAAQRASNQATDRDLTPNQLATLKELSRRARLNAAAAPTPSPTNASTPTTASTPAAAYTPATAITPSSVPTRRRRHPSPPLQPAPATLTTPAPAQNLLDSRDAVPETCAESYMLHDALSETVEHFKKLTGQVPRQSSTAKSYSSQWSALQTQFAPIWKSQRPAEEIPLLFKLCAWTGGISRWNSEMRMGGEERDREGLLFGEYMDATQEGTAYLGPDGSWRSVRDTWCNSHGRAAEGRRGRRDPTSEEDSGEESTEDSAERSEESSEEDSEDEAEKEPEEEAEQGSDSDFDIAE